MVGSKSVIGENIEGGGKQVLAFYLLSGQFQSHSMSYNSGNTSLEIITNDGSI